MVIPISDDALLALSSPTSRSAPTTPTYGAIEAGLKRRTTTLALCEHHRPRCLSGSRLGDIRDTIASSLGTYHSKLNILLLLVPVGIVAGLAGWNHNLVFVSNFLGMIPLAMILGRATEDVGSHTNQTIGALVNVTFGNAVEVILSISALRAGRLQLIQNTLVGSILSNLLLVLGSAFFAGGLAYKEQSVLRAVSEANADLLSFSVFAFSVPSLFLFALKSQGLNKFENVERLSLVVAICLLLIYLLYLLFQLYTHAEFYMGSADAEGGPGNSDSVESLEIDDRTPATLPVAVSILALTIGVVSVCSEFLIGSFDEFAKSASLSETFISIILLPIIANAVEHMSAILVAFHNRMDLAVGVACGSSVQIALFAAPLMVLISWMFPEGEKLTLTFPIFDAAALFLSVFVVNATLGDAKTNILEGAVLVACYVILAAAYFLMG